MDFNFTSQICTTRSQSERLLALGLKKETADMHHYQYVEGGRWNIEARPSIVGYNNRLVPAWSLHRLIEMMPDCITLKDNDIEEDYNNAALEIHHKAVIYESFMVKIYKFKKETNNLYDNLIDCIQWLIKEGYFNKNYLKE